MAIREDRDAKAELNRRSPGSVITLAVTGFRVAKLVEVLAHGHQGIAPRTLVWKVLADGPQACISQHLCSEVRLRTLCFGATVFVC